MPEPSVALHVLSRGQWKQADAYARWQDPDRIADSIPRHRATLLSNPLAGGDDEPAQLIGTLGDRIIGRMDLIPGELRVRGQPVRIYWASNLFVPEPFRKTLMGIMLVMKGQAVHPTTAAFGPSQAALPLYEKLRWSDLRLTRYIQLRRSRAVVEKYARPKALVPAASAAVDVALALHSAGISTWRAIHTSGLRVEQRDALPAEFDAPFQQRTEPVQCHRSAAFVNWMLANTFKDDPRNRQDLYLVYDDRAGGKIVAYFMTKVRFHPTATSRQFRNLLLGAIQDWFIVEPQRASLHQLVLLASAQLTRQKVDAIELNLPSERRFRWLKPMGFAPAGAVHFLYKAAPGSPLADPNLARIENWWCRPADGDNFFI